MGAAVVPAEDGEVVLEEDDRRAGRRYARGMQGRGRLDGGAVDRRDVLAATALFLVAEVHIAVAADPDALATTAVAAAVATLPLAVRRRLPLVPVASWSVAAVAQQALGGALFDASVYAAFAAFVLAVFGAARHAPLRRAVAALALAAGALFATTLVDDRPSGADEALWALVTVAAPWAGGRLVRSRSRLQAALRERTQALTQERDAHARRAAEEERRRIAHELHGIVAHGVSDMVVEASAVAAGARTDPETARAALAAIERSGRETLDDLRRLLRVLRTDEDPRSMTPQPGLAALDALAGRCAAEGLDVDVELTGTARPLSPGVELVAYRVVESALRDVGAAGIDRARVRLHFTADELTLHVEPAGDPRPARGGTSTPLAIRERLRLYGGQVRTAGDGLQARIPLEAAG